MGRKPSLDRLLKRNTDACHKRLTWLAGLDSAEELLHQLRDDAARIAIDHESAVTSRVLLDAVRESDLVEFQGRLRLKLAGWKEAIESFDAGVPSSWWLGQIANECRGFRVVAITGHRHEHMPSRREAKKTERQQMDPSRETRFQAAPPADYFELRDGRSVPGILYRIATWELANLLRVWAEAGDLHSRERRCALCFMPLDPKTMIVHSGPARAVKSRTTSDGDVEPVISAPALNEREVATTEMAPGDHPTLAFCSEKHRDAYYRWQKESGRMDLVSPRTGKPTHSPGIYESHRRRQRSREKEEGGSSAGTQD